MKLDANKEVTLNSILSLIETRSMACQIYDMMIEEDKKKGKTNPKLLQEFDNLWKSKNEDKRHLVSLIEWWLEEAYNNGVTDGRRGK